MAKNKVWWMNDSYYKVYFRSGLKRRFEAAFPNIDLCGEYWYKGKQVAVDYIVEKGELLDNIKLWLSKDKVGN